MKVILLKDVRNVGSHGSVCEVADGFARNYLFVRKLAEPATEEKMAEMAAQAAARDAAAKKEAAALDAKVASLNGKTVTLPARATEKGGLFKAVSAKDLARVIREQHSLEIPEDAIHLNEAVKTVGEHVASVHGASTKAALGIVVTAA
jgi:large subunit ribosomal protein L9